jgi:replicative DNA helicase
MNPKVTQYKDLIASMSTDELMNFIDETIDPTITELRARIQQLQKDYKILSKELEDFEFITGRK